MKIVAVGGTWNADGGRPSKVFARLARGIAEALAAPDDHVHVANGGPIELLAAPTADTDVLIWMPDVPNDHPKLIDQIKQSHPRVILVGSKRLDGRDITLVDVLNRMLHAKMNLGLVIDKQGDRFRGRVFDPLGNVFAEGQDFEVLGRALAERARFLRSMHRVGSVSIGPIKPEHIEDQQAIPPTFIDFVRGAATIFDRLVPRPKQVTRFLGNAAFRCSYGFPALRLRKRIYVSPRNIDKGVIGPESFVPVEPFRPFDPQVLYYGKVQPSVDTPVDLLLFDRYPSINFLIHGHVYIKDAPFTVDPIPCGAIEEFEAIYEAVGVWSGPWFCVNLRGHGCILGWHACPTAKPEAHLFYARPTEELV